MEDVNFADESTSLDDMQRALESGLRAAESSETRYYIRKTMQRIEVLRFRSQELTDDLSVSKP